MIAIKRVTVETALVFKGVRLRALQESPTAFSSTYAKESQLPGEEWVRRAVRWGADETAAIFLAFDGDSACGMVGSLVDDENANRAHVISMWVDPAYRRFGVGKALIDAVVEWNRSIGVSETVLMVTSVNTGAIAFYERIGFRMTGVTGPYPNDPAIIEHEMTLS
ncbi:MAG TPA: GNAT family N-acetyltransferase [Terracidiphilus sp.]